MSRARASTLRVLTYHRVAEPADSPELNPRLISATPRGFREQMEMLRRRFAVVSMREVRDAVDGDAGLPRRAVLVTFDDAYAGLLDHAVPTLRRLGIPATIFVPTAFPDHPERSFWADRLHRAFTRTERGEIATPDGSLPLRTIEERRESLRRLQDRLKAMPHAAAAELVESTCDALGVEPSASKSVLGWDDLRRLSTEGVTVAAHSRTHAILTRLPTDEARAEIAGAREDLERELGATMPVFSYPNGSHDDTVVSAVRDEGFRLAFTTLHGHNDLSRDDPLRLRRTNITPRTTARLFRARLTGWGGRIDAWRHRPN